MGWFVCYKYIAEEEEAYKIEVWEMNQPPILGVRTIYWNVEKISCC